MNIQTPIEAEEHFVPAIRIPLHAIARYVCQVFQIKRKELESESRRTLFVNPRFAFAYLTEIYRPDRSEERVAVVLKKHVSSIHEGRKSVRRVLEKDAEFRERVQQCVKKIEAWTPEIEQVELRNAYLIATAKPLPVSDRRVEDPGPFVHLGQHDYYDVEDWDGRSRHSVRYGDQQFARGLELELEKRGQGQ